MVYTLSTGEETCLVHDGRWWESKTLWNPNYEGHGWVFIGDGDSGGDIGGGVKRIVVKQRKLKPDEVISKQEPFEKGKLNVSTVKSS